jgi:hypothetical protein
MTDADRVKFLHDPYRPPRLRKGDRAVCLDRDADVVVTSWTDARIPWPRCRALHCRGGSGLLVTEELRRAILSESAAALMLWFGVGEFAVWAWRRAFGVTKYGTEGSARLHLAAVERGAKKTRGKPLPAKVWAEMRRAAAQRTDLAETLERARAKRWEGRDWTPEQVALLGTMPDEALAALTGRPESAVRVKRSKLGIPTYRDRRCGCR